MDPSFQPQAGPISSQNPGGSQKPDPKDDQLAAARQAFKQARKFLNAAVREAKKRKP